jgi:alpha-N-arabinofuranosidase
VACLQWFPLRPLIASAHFLKTVGLGVLCCAIACAEHIAVNPTVVHGAISPYIFGMGIEWTGNGDGVVDPTTGELRPEIMNLLVPLHIPVWRFPGGILSDYYHWQDGVGPLASRPMGTNPMDGTANANTFGTNEFIKFCQMQGSAALVTANYGTGTATEAVSWQQYFAGEGMPVRLWEIGNEIYLSEPSMPGAIPGDDLRIFHSASQYAADFPVWATALHSRDATALVGAVVGNYNTSPQNANWLQMLAGSMPAKADFVATHDAYAPAIFSSYNYSVASNRNAVYQAMYASPITTVQDIDEVQAAFANQNQFYTPRVAITEHFPLFGGSSNPTQFQEELDQTRTMSSALFTASLLQSLMRQGAWMANYNIAVSEWFGALVTDQPAGPVATPTYYVYDLYLNHFGHQLIDSQVTGAPTFSSITLGAVPATTSVPTLDAVASMSNDGKTVFLAVINRSLDSTVSSTISVAGQPANSVGQVYTLKATAANEVNGSTLTTTTVSSGSNPIHSVLSTWMNKTGDDSYQFPANSITIFSWSVTGS